MKTKINFLRKVAHNHNGNAVNVNEKRERERWSGSEWMNER